MHGGAAFPQRLARMMQAAKKRDFMTGSTVVHSEVRSSMLSSARIAFTQQYGELTPSLHHVCLFGLRLIYPYTINQ